MFSNPTISPHTFTAGTVKDSVQVPSGEFDTSVLITGESSEWIADTAGEIPYYCSIHNWMTGLIIITDMMNPSACKVPVSGDWIITTSCTINVNATAQRDVIIQNGSILSIPSGITLDVDLQHSI